MLDVISLWPFSLFSANSIVDFKLFYYVHIVLKWWQPHSFNKTLIVLVSGSFYTLVNGHGWPHFGKLFHFPESKIVIVFYVVFLVAQLG